MEEKHNLVDIEQSAWQLASIQLTGVTSLPVLFTSILLIRYNSFFNSLLILITINLFLWLIRYGLLKMSFEGRKSVMDITREYLSDIWGFKNLGIYAIALLLLFSALFLFIEETTIVCNALTQTFPIDEGPNIDPFMQISVIIGLISTFLCTWGIIALRKVSVFSLPFILLAYLFLIFTSYATVDFYDSRPFSMQGVSQILAINLAVTADLPTFFRHSASWKNSLKGLTIIQLLSFFIGVAGLFLGHLIQPVDTAPVIQHNLLSTSLIPLALIILVGLSSICSNVSNVYGSTVGWETFFKNALVGKKESLILGLLMTLIFLMITGLFRVKTLVEITGDALINLSFIFVMGYLLYRWNKEPLPSQEKNMLFFTWVLSTFLTTLYHINPSLIIVPPVFLGALTILVITLPALVLKKYKTLDG